MISLKLVKTDSINVSNYYFMEKVNQKTHDYWEVIWVENSKFNEKIFEGGICKY